TLAERDRLALRCASLEAQLERLLGAPYPGATGAAAGGPGIDPALLAAARQEIAMLRNSTSWRITAPLRRIMDRLRGLGRKG
ncbi:hypothetical protein, partial [Teichococcus cervicalis]